MPRTRTLRLAALLVALWTATAARAELELEGFRASPEELQSHAQRICLRAATTEYELKAWPTRKAWFEQFLAHKLAQRGFELVPSERVEAAALAARREAGGIYDPLTGRPMPAKRMSVASAERERLVNELGCQALLRPEIQLVRVRYGEKRAEFDHVSHALDDAEDSYGRMTALSLWIELQTPEGTELLARGGGIETLALVKGRGAFAPAGFEEIDPSRLLATDVWNARAVLAALGALALPPTPGVTACLAEPDAAKTDLPTRRARCELREFTFVPPSEARASPGETSGASKPLRLGR
jgi:hypothetical protein